MPRYTEIYTPRFLEAALGDIQAIHATAHTAAGRPDLAWYLEFNPEHPEEMPLNDSGLGLAVRSTAVWPTTINGLHMQVRANNNSLEPISVFDESIQQLIVRWERPREAESDIVNGPSNYYLNGFDTVFVGKDHDTEMLLEATGQPDFASFLTVVAEAVNGVELEMTEIVVCFSHRIENDKSWRYDMNKLTVTDTQYSGSPMRHRVEARFGLSRLFAVYEDAEGGLEFRDFDFDNTSRITPDQLYSMYSAIGDLLLKFGVHASSN